MQKQQKTTSGDDASQLSLALSKHWYIAVGISLLDKSTSGLAAAILDFQRI